MPSVVNGCGTWYYGKANKIGYEGFCEACGNLGLLVSYDTRLWVVFLMIPIVPLGRKRIIEECPACRKHRVMSLRLWEEARRRVATTAEDFRRSRHSADAATTAIHATVGVRDKVSFLEIAPEIEAAFRGNLTVLMTLASAHELFGNIAEQERLLRVAIEISNSDDISEALAQCLIRQNQPEEAHSYLQHVIDKRIPDRVNDLFQLAQAYQRGGDHERALEIYAACEAVNPLIKEDPVFENLRQASIKARGTSKRVMPGEIAARVQRRASWRKFTRMAPIALALACIGYTCVSLIQGYSRKIYVLSGLERTYTVRINGTPCILPPYGKTTLRVPEGKVRVEIVDPPLPVEPETLTIATPFLTRPFADDTFVINPDGGALLERVRIYYTAQSVASAPNADHNYLPTGTLHHLRGLDVVLENFPDTVSMDARTTQTHRDGLFLSARERSIPQYVSLAAAAGEIGVEKVLEATRRHLKLEPENSDYLHLLDLAAQEDALATLRLGLARRPVLIDWHRQYQTIMANAGRTEELEREYAAMTAGDARDTDMIYLAGRSCRNPARRRAAYEKAIQGDHPCAHAFYSLAYLHASQGNFAAALPFATRAMNLLGEEFGVSVYCQQVFAGAGASDQQLAAIKSDQNRQMPFRSRALAEEVYFHASRQDRQKADRAMQQLRQCLSNYDPQDVRKHLKEVEAERAYIEANLQAYVQLCRELQDPSFRFGGELTAGDMAKAEEALKDSSSNSDGMSHLLLSVLATQKGELVRAEKHLKLATEAMAQDDAERRIYVDILLGKPNADAEFWLDLPDELSDKATILTAIGQRDPSRREAAFALARKLNFNLRFPHLLLQNVLQSQPAP